MSKIPIHHYQILIKHGDTRGQTISGKPEDNYHMGTKAIDEEEEDIYTGEFINIQKTEKDNPNLWFLKRKSKDTYVFLKDYKPKITEIITRLGRLEFQFGHLRKNKRKEDKELRRRIGEREKNLYDEIGKRNDNILNSILPLIRDLKTEWKIEKEQLIEKIEKLEEEAFEKIEKFEEDILNLKNPPLKPELKNPFD